MNKLNKIIEQEQLQKDRDMLKQITEDIVKSHNRSFKRDIVKEQIRQAKEEFNKFACNNDLSPEEQEGARKFLIFQINNIN